MVEYRLTVTFIDIKRKPCKFEYIHTEEAWYMVQKELQKKKVVHIQICVQRNEK